MSAAPVRLVQRVRTPLPITEMLRVGAEAYELEFGETISRERLAMAGAQWTCEHGVQPNTAKTGRVIWSIWNHNWGNHTCWPDDDCDKTQLTTKERVVRKGDRLKSGGVAPEDVWKVSTLSYVAHPAHLDGARAYWRRMAEAYPESLKAFDSGSPATVAKTLSDERYYSDLVEKYATCLGSYFPRYVRLLSTGSER